MAPEVDNRNAELADAQEALASYGVGVSIRWCVATSAILGLVISPNVHNLIVAILLLIAVWIARILVTTGEPLAEFFANSAGRELDAGVFMVGRIRFAIIGMLAAIPQLGLLLAARIDLWAALSRPVLFDIELHYVLQTIGFAVAMLVTAWLANRWAASHLR